MAHNVLTWTEEVRANMMLNRIFKTTENNGTALFKHEQFFFSFCLLIYWRLLYFCNRSTKVTSLVTVATAKPKWHYKKNVNYVYVCSIFDRTISGKRTLGQQCWLTTWLAPLKGQTSFNLQHWIPVTAQWQGPCKGPAYLHLSICAAGLYLCSLEYWLKQMCKCYYTWTHAMKKQLFWALWTDLGPD